MSEEIATKSQKETFDPNSTFFDLPIVWRTVGFFTGLSLLVSILIVMNGNYTFEPSAAGFNLFIKDFSFPLGILSLLIPVIAVYGAQHRSAMMVEQIKESQNQNAFANYYKHQEEFEKFVNQILSNMKMEEKLTVTNYAVLYKMMFPSNDVTHLKLEMDETNYVENYKKCREGVKRSLSSSVEGVTSPEINVTPAEDIKKAIRNVKKSLGLFGLAIEDQLMAELKREDNPYYYLDNMLVAIGNNLIHFSPATPKKGLIIMIPSGYHEGEVTMESNSIPNLNNLMKYNIELM